MDEEDGNPFDDSNVMAPPEQPREATGDAQESVEQDAAQSTQASQLEPPSTGIHRSTTFPARLRIDLSPNRQGENDPPEPEPIRSRHRGTTLSSIRQSVDRADRLGSIHEDRPLDPEKQADNVAASVKSPSVHGTSGMRDRSASVASRRRQRTSTFNRAPTIFRRPTIVATGVSSAYGGSGGEEVPGGFTLAGADSTQAAQNQPYVDPAYAALNPAYVQPTNNRPVWGLAKPLPRVLRPGMVPAPSELNIRQDNGSLNENASVHDIDDLERGQPSLRRAGTFQAAQNLRDQREIKMLQRAGTLPISETSRLSVDEHAAGRVATVGEPFPNLALPTPIPEGREDEDGGDYFGQTESHSYSYVPSATRHATTRFDDGHSDTTDVEHDDEWPAFTPYDVKMGQPEDEIHNHHTHWSIIRTRYREPLAEFLAVRPSFLTRNGDDMLTPPLGTRPTNNRFQRRSLRHRFQKPQQLLSLICMGFRLHGRHLHCWWNLRSPSQPRHFNHALDLPRFPPSQSPLLHLRPNPRRLPRRPHLLRSLPQRHHRIRRRPFPRRRRDSRLFHY